jgi:dihydrofolate reductase
MMKQCVSIIVAMAENNVIGNKNRLIWQISADLRRFKAITMGHPVIMGRKTFESIGKALPGRHNIIISRQKGYKAPDCITVTSLSQALKLFPDAGEIFIIGGGEIYRQALPLADKLYLTKVHASFEGDTVFPEVDGKEWQLIHEETISNDPRVSFAYSFLDFVRKRN